jgi:hypothetical protein
MQADEAVMRKEKHVEAGQMPQMPPPVSQQ